MKKKGKARPLKKKAVPVEEFWEAFRPLLEKELSLLRLAANTKLKLDKEGRLLFAKARAENTAAGIGRTSHSNPVVSPDCFHETYKLLLALGGQREGSRIIFGKATEMQMHFRPKTDGKMRVSYSMPLGHDLLRAELNGHGRGLWDNVHNRPGPEYRAIENATNIRQRVADVMEGLRSGLKTRALAGDIPSLFELREALADLLACCGNEKLANRLNKAYDFHAQFSQESQFSFNKLSHRHFESAHESKAINHLKKNAWDLADKLQRPPSMMELRESSTEWGEHQLKEFKIKLGDAGLAWLPSERKLAKIRRRR